MTSDSLEAVEQAADSLTTYLQEGGWALNPQKVQGLGLSVKFLGVVWSGKNEVLKDASIPILLQLLWCCKDWECLNLNNFSTG